MKKHSYIFLFVATLLVASCVSCVDVFAAQAAESDTVTASANKSLRKSHYYDAGMISLLDTHHDEIDYAITVVEHTGNGSAYVTTTPAPVEPGDRQTYIEWDCEGVPENHSTTHYLYAVPDDGWYFSQWRITYDDRPEVVTSSNNPHKEDIVLAHGVREYYDYEGNPTYEDPAVRRDTVKAKATFLPVLVNSVSPSSVNAAPADPRVGCEDYSGKVVFAVTGADDWADFNVVPPVLSGFGTFVFDTVADFGKNTITVNWRFHGNGTYGISGASPRNRHNSATLRVESKAATGSPLSQQSTITANFPNVTIAGSDAAYVTTTAAPSFTKDIVFTVRYADNTGDFAAWPLAFEDVSGGTWTVNSCTYSGTDYATGEGTVTVNYTFTAASAGAYSAKLVLAANAAAGSASKTLNLSVDVDAVADYDAWVTDKNGIAVNDGAVVAGKASLADAVAYANAHRHTNIQLKKDVALASALTITDTTVIDLNGFSLSGSDNLLGVTGGRLTVTTSRGEGRLSVSGSKAGKMSAVSAAGGVLVLDGVQLAVTNSNSGTSDAVQAIGVLLASGGKAMVQGGSITATRTAGGYAYGVWCSDGTMADVREGCVIRAEAEAGSYACGLHLAGKSPVSGVEVSAAAAHHAYAVEVASGATVVVENGRYAASADDNAAAVVSAGSTRILGGTFSAAAGASAFAVRSTGGALVVTDGTYTASASSNAAFTLNISAGTASVLGGSFSAGALVSDARAVNVSGSASLTTAGGTFSAAIDRTGLGATTDAYAYALYAGADATVKLKNSTFRAVTTNCSYAYGIYSDAILSLDNIQVSAVSKSVGAFAVRAAGNTTIASSRLSAESAGAWSVALTLSGAVEAEVSGTSFITANGTNNVDGVLVDGASRAATGATVSASGTGAEVKAVSVNTGSAEITNSSVTAKGSASAHGIYNNAVLAVSGGTAEADGYALLVTSSSASTRISAGHFFGTAGAFGKSGESTGRTVFSGGYFNTNSTITAAYLADGYEFFDIPFGTADYSAGYRYSIGTASAPGIAVCRNVQTDVTYNTLADALQEVTSGQTIVMMRDYTLPAGNYILPAGATLLVPYYSSQLAALTTISMVVKNNPILPEAPSPFYTLTLAPGANLKVRGNIEISAQTTSAGGSLENLYITGATCGRYGYLVMNEGSGIELESGSNMWCWGYATGTGTIEVKNGANIYEPFVLGWWKGGTALTEDGMAWGAKGVFPFTDYYYQNIEVPVKYRPGALAFATGGIHVSLGGFDMDARATVQLVGTMNKSNGDPDDNGLFLMNEGDTRTDSWVQKIYHAESDSIEWMVNSGANLSNLSLDLGIDLGSGPLILDTREVNLPIANNMTITLNYGRMEIMQNTVFLPGSKMDIKKEATVYIPGGKSMYLYDSDEWALPNGGNYYILPKYSPTWGTANPRAVKYGYNQTTPLPSAEMFVHGRFEIESDYVEGGAHLYTTAGGANIHSTNEDAGMVLFMADAPSEDYELWQWTETPTRYTEKTASAAQLRNADGTYAATLGTEAWQLWGYKNNRWVKMKVGSDECTCECFYSELDEEGNETGVRNAYPSAFLEIEPNSPDDHAYHAADNPSHYLINTEAAVSSSDCVWWDAEPVSDNCYMITKESSELYGSYYSYDEDEELWKPRVNTITWRNANAGTDVKLGYNLVAQNAVPKYSGKVYNDSEELVLLSDPAQAGDATYDYFWDGWVTAKADWNNADVRVLDNNSMPVATADVTYYAHYKKVMKQYSITFLNENGTLIEEVLVDAGTVPECSAPPAKESTDEYDYSLTWTPSLAAASAPASYRASFTPVTRKYTVTFANFNGDVLKTAEVDYGTDLAVAVNFNAAKPASDPTRQNDGFYSYDFTGWSPAPGVVTGAVTYTAQFTLTDWTPEYEITFLNYDGEVLQTQYVRFGNDLTDPSVSQIPEREEDESGTYTFTGWSPALVTTPDADAEYTAQYSLTPKTYTIVFKDYDGAVLQRSDVNGGTMPSAPAAPSRESTAQYNYAFTGWSPAVVAATADAEYIAQYSSTVRTYTIRFLNYDGTVLETDASVAYGATPSYDGATPSRAAEGYTGYVFDYWYPSMTPVTGNRDYKATYRTVTATYTIVFKDYDGTVLQSTVVTGGDMPETPASPSRENTAQYEYAFTGWSPSVGVAAADAEYTAQYSQTLRTYTVRFLDYDDTVLETDAAVAYGSMPSYDGATPSRPSEGNTNYVFDGWEPSLASVTGDADYRAAYIARVGYVRSVSADEFGTICLPYAVPAEGIMSGVEVWNIIGYANSEGTELLYEPVTSMEAGHAYVFYSPVSEINFLYDPLTGPVAAVAASFGHPLQGYIGASESDKKWLVEGDYVLHHEGWMRVTGSGTDWIFSNRAYLCIAYITPYAAVPAARAGRCRTFPIQAAPNTATGTDVNNAVFAQPEKMIVNGHLRIVMPDGTIYDATGRKLCK